MGSMIGYFVIILLAAGSVLAAALFFRHRQKQVMNGLSDMLEAAINGTFSETTFDESRQSSLENRLAQYLAASELSVRSIDAEREKIKELIADISHQTRTPLSNILLYTELLEEEPLGELEHNNNVCITFSVGHKLVYQHEKVACSYSMRSESAMCRGQVEFIEEIDEKRRALDIIMRHYTDSEFNYSDPAVRNVKVWQVRINQMTGKVFGLRANEKP